MIKLFLAPLKGFTDYIYREVYADKFTGIDIAVTPFIATTRDHKISKSRIKDILPENNRKMKIVPQILSNNHEDFIHLANYIYDLGYDEVNLNLGCPHRTVTAKKKGSALLRDTIFLGELIENILKGIKGTLSVKIRTGYTFHDELSGIIDQLNRYPLKRVIVHPRTTAQKYTGSVNLDILGKEYKRIESEAVYNGDIFTLSDFKNIKKRINIKCCMLGRGLLFNPFLPSEIKNNIKEKDYISEIKEFHDLLSESYREKMSGPSHYLDRMKGVWFFLSQSFRDGDKLLKKIRKTRDVSKYKKTVNQFFREDPVWDPENYTTEKV